MYERRLPLSSTVALAALGLAASSVIAAAPEQAADEAPAKREGLVLVAPAPEPEPVEPPEPPEPVYLGDDGEHVDAERLRAWLDDVDSPLTDHAETIIEAGVAYDVDPRLVVAIAMTESTAGHHKPAGSHNAWGWGGDGPSGLAAWDSWPEAIDHFTWRFSELYDASSIDRAMERRYCPPCDGHWLSTVRSVYGDI